MGRCVLVFAAHYSQFACSFTSIFLPRTNDDAILPTYSNLLHRTATMQIHKIADRNPASVTVDGSCGLLISTESTSAEQIAYSGLQGRGLHASGRKLHPVARGHNTPTWITSEHFGWWVARDLPSEAGQWLCDKDEPRWVTSSVQDIAWIPLF